MDDHDHEQVQRELRKMAQFPPPFERLHQETLRLESSFVADRRRARLVVYSWPAKFALMLGAVFVQGRTDGWVGTVAGLVLITFAAIGVGGGLRRAQAYRNGWVDRGSHDVTEQKLCCGDPVCEEAFERRMQQLNLEAVL